MILQFTWSSTADEDDNHQTTITCKATKKTWANQRRKRRLAAQHQQTVAKKSKEESEKQPEGTCRQDNISISTTPLVDSCHLEFTCSAFHDGVNKVQFKYLLGDSKDDLHQVIQYLKNQLTESYKQEQHTMHQQHHKQQQ